MLCPKCQLRKTDTGLCEPCQIRMVSDKSIRARPISDNDILAHHILNRVQDGCRECKSKAFAYEAGVNYENSLKWYIIKVDCGNCSAAYEEIMEIRMDINESIKYEKSK